MRFLFLSFPGCRDVSSIAGHGQFNAILVRLDNNL
jgi:hypothetical protein